MGRLTDYGVTVDVCKSAWEMGHDIMPLLLTTDDISSDSDLHALEVDKFRQIVFYASDRNFEYVTDAIIFNLAFTYSPADLSIYVIDFRGGRFWYSDLPHVKCPSMDIFVDEVMREAEQNPERQVVIVLRHFKDGDKYEDTRADIIMRLYGFNRDNFYMIHNTQDIESEYSLYNVGYFGDTFGMISKMGEWSGYISIERNIHLEDWEGLTSVCNRVWDSIS